MFRRFYIPRVLCSELLASETVRGVTIENRKAVKRSALRFAYTN